MPGSPSTPMSGRRLSLRSAGLRLAAISRRAAADLPPVVEPEIARHAGQQHQVGLAQRLAALVAQL